MPKPHLRPAAAGACFLLAAAPALGQSARQAVSDVVNAVHEEQRSRASARDADRQAYLADIEVAYARRQFAEQVRPHCKAYPERTSTEDLDPFVVKKAMPAALYVCAAFETVWEEEYKRKHSPKQEILDAFDKAPR